MKDSYEKLGKNKKESMFKTKLNDTMLFVQGVLLGALLICLVISFFLKEIMIVVNVLLGLIFIVMGYNNQKVFKRKYFTLVYYLLGIYFIITSIIGLI